MTAVDFPFRRRAEGAASGSGGGGGSKAPSATFSRFVRRAVEVFDGSGSELGLESEARAFRLRVDVDARGGGFD